MKHQQWLTRYIEDAFADVQLADGMDIHLAESMDGCGNPEEERLSLTAERHDWRLVSGDTMASRSSAFCFMDAVGFRFYTPAVMTTLINDGDHSGMLLTAFLGNLHVSIHGTLKQVQFSEVFTRHQRAAIIRFLKYLIHHGGGYYAQDDASLCLNRIQNRTES